ncbi:HWE histidine kinase domain-containing protein [uncultured Jannaschia sp.]|uniref:sensor histidine kinase n=1 Tax=uncultured Jannaschia sp. TaxID=293347 RepID=UPI0026304BA1|nr:HWE histidine kinase domain-containing protein [uncultured Jannaschia sp.]
MDARTSKERLRSQRAALADFGLFAFRCEKIDELLHRAAELVSDAMGVPLVKVLEHHPARSEMLLRSGVNWEPGVVGHETFGDYERSPGGYALAAEQPVVSSDLDAEERFDVPEVLLRHGVKSMVNVVIAGDAAPFGVLEVDAREKRDFSEDDVAFLRTYANLLAAAIERVRTHDELHRTAREQGVLARELGHRVKNLLGLVRALASQTSTQGRNAKEYRAAFIDRLQALSTAESLVFESSGERVDPLTLANEILSPYRQDDPGKIAIRGASIDIDSRQARMFGLVLHELATNAAKYGALSVPTGHVGLDWHLETSDGDIRRLAMTWREQDGPAITPPERKGFGTRLLEDVVAFELNGTAELVYGPDGLRYDLTFPAAEA